MNFRFRSSDEICAAYKLRHRTPLEVATRALKAKKSFDTGDLPLRHFIALDEADVLAQARASSERWAKGAPLSELDGIPIAIKDEYDVIGYGTTCGTSVLGKSLATQDAVAVARLRALGAIIFGKTNMHEMGVSSSGVNVHHGVARNPYDPLCDTGGSSSGSAGAVAAGIVPIALGNDGGGSIRIPGALCGVAGYKGTFGHFPLAGVRVLCWSLEHAGPIAGTVSDVRKTFSLVTGAPASQPKADSLQILRGLRVGICDSWWAIASLEMAALVDRAVQALVAHGASLHRVDMPYLRYATPVGIATFGVEGAASAATMLAGESNFAPSVRLTFDMARGISATSYLKTQRVRALINRDFTNALDGVDVLITPTTATTAPRYHPDAFSDGEIDEATVNGMIGFTMPLNLTGLPAMQVPCGYDAGGMPVGMQIIARHSRDLLPLQVASAVEKLVESRRPSVYCDLLA